MLADLKCFIATLSRFLISNPCLQFLFISMSFFLSKDGTFL